MLRYCMSSVGFGRTLPTNLRFSHEITLYHISTATLRYRFFTTEKFSDRLRCEKISWVDTTTWMPKQISNKTFHKNNGSALSPEQHKFTQSVLTNSQHGHTPVSNSSKQHLEFKSVRLGAFLCIFFCRYIFLLGLVHGFGWQLVFSKPLNSIWAFGEPTMSLRTPLYKLWKMQTGSFSKIIALRKILKIGKISVHTLPKTSFLCECALLY